MSVTVADILDRCRRTGTRIIVSYASDDGVDWLEEFDTTGFVSVSCGRSPVPILLATSRSIGGGAISVDRVVRIREARGKRELYRRHNYRQPVLTMHQCDQPGLPIEVRSNGEPHRRFATERAMLAWASRMGVEIGGAA